MGKFDSKIKSKNSLKRKNFKKNNNKKSKTKLKKIRKKSRKGGYQMGDPGAEQAWEAEQARKEKIEQAEKQKALAEKALAFAQARAKEEAQKRARENEELEKRYRCVIFIRHCESCSNVVQLLGGFTNFFKNTTNSIAQKIKKGKENSTQKFLREPLCTELGIKQSIFLGNTLNNKVEEIKNRYYKETSKELKGISFYSSVLPRATETAKMITYGYSNKENNEELIAENNSEIIQMGYCQEKSNPGEFFDFKKKGTQNTTIEEKRQCHIKLLNSLFKNIGYPISNTLIGEKKQYYVSDKNDYTNLKKMLYNNTQEDTLSVIVSHGKYIREEILKDKDVVNYQQGEEVNNLDAFLVIYKNDSQILGMPNANPIYIEKIISVSKNEVQDQSIPDSVINDINNRKFIDCKYSYENDIQPTFCIER